MDTEIRQSWGVRNQELVFADAVSASQDENNSGSE
jgi:hypothetical protein